MENTTLNKQKFFAQYWGQLILMKKDGLGVKKCVPAYWEKTISTRYLELTPLHLITDQQLAEICDISEVYIGNHELDQFSDFEIMREWLLSNGVWCDKMLDYIRDNGFAYRFNGLSVEEQVSRGWVVLKTKI